MNFSPFSQQKNFSIFLFSIFTMAYRRVQSFSFYCFYYGLSPSSIFIFYFLFRTSSQELHYWMGSTGPEGRERPPKMTTLSPDQNRSRYRNEIRPDGTVFLIARTGTTCNLPERRYSTRESLGLLQLLKNQNQSNVQSGTTRVQSSRSHHPLIRSIFPFKIEVCSVY